MAKKKKVVRKQRTNDAKREKFEHEFPAEFGGCGKNKSGKAVSLGIEVAEAELGGDQARMFAVAEELFNGAQLRVYLVGSIPPADKNAAGDIEGQQVMDIAQPEPVADGEIEYGPLIAQVLQFSRKDHKFTASMKFAASAIDMNRISAFTGRVGELRVNRMGQAERPKRGRPKSVDPDDVEAEMDEEADGDDA